MWGPTFPVVPPPPQDVSGCTMVAIVNVFILRLFCWWFCMHYLIQPSKQAYMVGAVCIRVGVGEEEAIMTTGQVTQWGEAPLCPGRMCGMLSLAVNWPCFREQSWVSFPTLRALKAILDQLNPNFLLSFPATLSEGVTCFEEQMKLRDLLSRKTHTHCAFDPGTRRPPSPQDPKPSHRPKLKTLVLKLSFPQSRPPSLLNS